MLDPDGPPPRNPGTEGVYVLSWSERLGSLYSDTLLGDSDQRTKAWARERLEKANDPVVLLAGYSIAVRTPDHELQAFGRRLLERASQLDSSAAAQARERLRQLDSNDRDYFRASLTEESRARALASASGAAKLQMLTQFAEMAYLMAESSDWRARQLAGIKGISPGIEQDKRAAAEGFTKAKAYAREAIELAPSLAAAGVAVSSVQRARRIRPYPSPRR
jgi:hypothetical protein